MLLLGELMSAWKLDVSNNNYLPGEDVPRANMPYYGIDFPGMIPTGRFGNGYAMLNMQLTVSFTTHGRCPRAPFPFFFFPLHSLS